MRAQYLVSYILILLVTSFKPSRALAVGEEGNAGVKRYDPSWESLKRYQVPEWFKDAKFGIFLHWGVYAVPAAGNEWYPRNMYLKDEPMFKHHREIWGDQSKFGYKDFAPLFKADKWDPQAWAELFKKVGARFVVPVAEHHDGFAMYASSHTRWNSAEMGPKRDLVGELSKAVRAQGMKFGAFSHYAHNWNYYPHSEEFDTSDPKLFGLYGKPHAPGAPASEEFLETWYARVKEIIDKYQPDVLWFDFGFNRPEFEPFRQRIGAYYYNKGLEWNKGVVLQYKKEAFPYGTAVLDIERGKLDRIRPIVWQTDTSVSWESWGYIENDRFKTADSLVDDLVDIVSKNGVLLLNAGPRDDGTIPDEAADILLEIGKWLEVNGEAIYGTRPWHTYGEGPTTIHADSFGESKSQPFTAKDIRFTTKGNVLYAICQDWPGEEVNVASLSRKTFLGSEEVSDISLLGSREKLPWSRDEKGLKIKLPAQRPGDYAYVFKVILESEVLGTVK